MLLSFPILKMTSLVAQMVKCLRAMQETRVRSLGWEDPLEKEMVTHSSTLAWKIPWTEEPGRLQSMGSQRVRHNWETSLHFHILKIKKLKISKIIWFLQDYPRGNCQKDRSDLNGCKRRLLCRVVSWAGCPRTGLLAISWAKDKSGAPYVRC